MFVPCSSRICLKKLMNYAILNHNEGSHLDGTQPNYVSPARLPAVLSHFHVLRALQVGPADSGDCRPLRWHRRADRANIQPAFFAGGVSRSHSGQTSALVVIYRPGFQEAVRVVGDNFGVEPRPAHPDCGRGYHSRLRLPSLSAEHLWQVHHIFSNPSGICRSALGCLSGATPLTNDSRTHLYRYGALRFYRSTLFHHGRAPAERSFAAERNQVISE